MLTATSQLNEKGRILTPSPYRIETLKSIAQNLAQLIRSAGRPRRTNLVTTHSRITSGQMGEYEQQLALARSCLTNITVHDVYCFRCVIFCTSPLTSCRREASTICPAPCDLDIWHFDLESGVRVTCDMGYLCANFSIPTPLCSRLRPDVRDRQDVRQHHRLMPPPRGHNKRINCSFVHHTIFLTQDNATLWPIQGTECFTRSITSHTAPRPISQTFTRGYRPTVWDSTKKSGALTHLRNRKV